MQETIPLLSKEHFENVLREVMLQVFEGKGNERHGHGDSFEQQPWKLITDNVGTGFVIGQAMKKLMELKSFSNSIEGELSNKAYQAWKREALGAIVYIVMSIMYRDGLNHEEQKLPDPETE